MTQPFPDPGRGEHLLSTLKKMLVTVLLSCLASASAKDPTQFAPEHWLQDDETEKPIVPKLGYGPTPGNIPVEFDCAWREYGEL